MIEGKGFLKLIDYLESNYQVPSRNFVIGVIHKKHKAAKKKLQDKLEAETNSIAITMDIWTNSATEAYIIVSAH